MKSNRIWLIFLSLAVAGNVASGGQPLLLDLSTPAVAQYERSLARHCITGGVGGSVDGVSTPHTLPVRVEILSLDRTSYKVGEAIRGALLLTNTSQHSIPIPWSLDPDIVEGKDCSWPPLPPGVKPLHGSVAILLVDDDGNSEPVSAHYLFGRTSDPATYRNLAPGESLEIRMLDRLDVSFLDEQRQKEKKKPLALPARLKVVGSFEYNDAPGFGEYPDVLSGNSIQVTVTDK